MPSAGRATGAVLLALVCLGVAALIAIPEGLPRGPARVAAAAFGALFGWRLGRGPAGAARGMTAALLAASWTLLAGAAWQMLRRSLRGLYADPAEALGEAAALVATYGRALLHPAPAALLLIGGAAVGVAAAWVARRLP